MMLHVPAVRTTLVDVEREAMESVFIVLQSIESAIPVFFESEPRRCGSIYHKS